MITPAAPSSLCVPSSPPVPTSPEWLAVVCPGGAPPLSLRWPAPVRPVPRVTLVVPGRGSRLLGNRLAVVTTIGSAPQTR